MHARTLHSSRSEVVILGLIAAVGVLLILDESIVTVVIGALAWLAQQRLLDQAQMLVLSALRSYWFVCFPILGLASFRFVMAAEPSDANRQP